MLRIRGLPNRPGALRKPHTSAREARMEKPNHSRRRPGYGRGGMISLTGRLALAGLLLAAATASSRVACLEKP